MAVVTFPASMSNIEYDTPNCPACMLQRASRLPLYGQGGKRILVLFDHQDAIQQSSKTYGCGERFDTIRDILADYGVDMALDCWTTSSAQCYALNPSEQHVMCCKPEIDKIIRDLKPRLILAVGEFTAKALLLGHISGVYLDRVHGIVHNSRKYNCNIVFTYAPHHKVFGKTYDIDDLIIRRDIHLAMMSLHKERTVWKDEATCIRILSETEAISELKRCIADPRKRVAALDYETTGLRPYNTGAEIVSCAIAEDRDDSFSFMVTPNVIPVLREYWLTNHILKIAQNTAFERTWTIVQLGIYPVLLKIDTMLLFHLLDNRESQATSIKFTAPMLLGTPEWESETVQYKVPSKEDQAKYGSYALNTMKKCPMRPLLKYNGIDSLVEFRVFTVLWDLLQNYHKTFPNYDLIKEFMVK